MSSLKKIISFSLIIVLLIVAILPTYNVNANAGLAIKAGTKGVKSLISAISVKKGVRKADVIDIDLYRKNHADAVAKKLQDTAMESFDALETAVGNAQPVQNMPGWLKVTIGTTLFLTSADMALETYNFIAGNQEIEAVNEFDTVINDSAAVMTQAGYWNIKYETDPTNANKHFMNLYFNDVKKTNFTTSNANDIKMRMTWIPKSETYPYGAWHLRQYRDGAFYADRGLYIIKDTDIAVTSSQPAVYTKKVPQAAFSYSANPIPTESQVEVIFPDPAVHSDPAKTVNENEQVIIAYQGDGSTNPDPEPDPDPSTGGEGLTEGDKTFFTGMFAPLNSILEVLQNIWAWLQNLVTNMAQAIWNFFATPLQNIQNSLEGIRNKPDPAPDPAPNGSGINLDPLKSLGGQLTEKFPFSLPWDIKRVVEGLQGGGDPPDLYIAASIGDGAVKEKLVFPDWVFTMQAAIRNIAALLFIVGLIFATRKLLGGSV